MLNVKSFILFGCILGILAMVIATKSQANQEQDFYNPLIPRQLLFGNPEKTSPQISPDGTKLAYLAPDKDNVLNVWIKDLKNEQNKDRIVTSDHKRGIRNFLWQFDNNHILYVQDKDGDENWHLYQTDISTAETRNLTPYDGSRVSIVGYEPKFPDQILVQINHRDKSLFDVYRINLATADCQLDTENPDRAFHWVADNDLQVRACQSYTKEGANLVRVRDDVKSPWRELLTLNPDEIGGEVVGFSPDNKNLYLLSSINGNTNRLLQLSVSGGEPKLIAEDPQYDLDSVMINPITHELEAIALERERFSWIILDPNLKSDFDRLGKIEKGIFKITTRTTSNRQWVVAFISDQHPTHFYLYDRDSQKAQYLFTSQPALEKYKLNAMTPISFQARDGMTIHGYLTLPAEETGRRPLPTILYVHGGPWVRDSWGFNPAAQWLSNRGYAVLQINYRGSAGYGKHYLNAGNREWAGKMHLDLLDGKQWMIDKGYTDPEKVGIYGGSYGGYATLVGLTFTPDEFCCGVDVVGPSNLITLLKTFPPYWGPLKAQTDRRIGKLETEEEFLQSRSPLFKADSIKKPLLIGHGANDPRVKQAESDQIVEAMRRKQLPVEYLLFTDEGHGFARPENRLKFYAAAEHFLSTYVGGRSESPSESENWEALKR